MQAPNQKENARLPVYRHYDWTSGDHDIIRRALKRRRVKLAKLLDIDIHAVEGWIEPPPIPDDGQPQSPADYIAWRDTPGKPWPVKQIDLVLDELAVILTWFAADLANVNDLATRPQIIQILEKVSRKNDMTETEFENLDPKVRMLLDRDCRHEQDQQAHEKWLASGVRATALDLLATLKRPSRGRPKGTANEAAIRLGAALERFFASRSPKQPSRSVIVNKNPHSAHPDIRESGPFHTFFQLTTNCLPPHVRQRLTKKGAKVDYPVRRSVGSAKPG